MVLTLWKRTINNSETEENRWIFYFSLKGLARLQAAYLLPVSLICSGAMFCFMGSSYCHSNLTIHPSIHPSICLPLIQGWLGYPRHRHVASPQQHFPAPPEGSWGSPRPEETYIIPPASSRFGHGPDILERELPGRYPNQMITRLCRLLFFDVKEQQLYSQLPLDFLTLSPSPSNRGNSRLKQISLGSLKANIQGIILTFFGGLFMSG